MGNVVALREATAAADAAAAAECRAAHARASDRAGGANADRGRQGNRNGHRDATMILIAFRHGLRASELVDLRWDR